MGRERELGELGSALEEARGGRGRLYLVSGEPGIGKTRLCDELSATARAQAIPVVWGRSWEAGGAPAYFPWRAPLSLLGEMLPAASLADALGEGASALLRLLPGLGTRLSSPPPAVIAESADSERFRLYFAVTALVRAASAAHGALLVLDDLHAADESSLALLCFLARELRSTRTLVVATYRDVEARATREVGEALGRLRREATLLSVTRLGPEASAAILRERGGIDDGEVQQAVFRRTQGNPLFLEHMAEMLRERGGPEAARELLPTGVRELLGQRLARISLQTRALLETSAVSGDEFDPARIASASASTGDAVRAAFGEAVVAGLLVERDAGRYRFSHALVREVLERDLSPERGRALHGALAQALAAEVGAESTLHAELAHHGLLGPDDGLPRAIGHALFAARRSFALLAFEEAIVLLERARVALEGSSAHVPAREALLCDVLTTLGEAQIRRGHGAAGQASCLRAAELARVQGDPERLAWAALAYGREITAALVQQTLVALLEEALSALPVADSSLRVQVSARLAAAMQPHRDLSIPIEIARTAIASARRIGEPATLLDALYSGMAAMMDIVDPRERLPLNLEIEQLATEAGDRDKQLRSQARLVFDHMELGDLAGADARIAAYEQLAMKMGAPRHLWRVPLFRSMRALVHGRFAEAEALLEEASALAKDAGDPQLERCSIFHREGILRAAERHEAMIAFDPEARRMRAALYSGPHWQNGGSAFTHVRVEDFDSARMYLALVPQDDWPLIQNPTAFMHLGEPLALIGERRTVEKLYAQLLPAAHRHLSWGWTKFLWDGPVARVLGLLAAHLERWDEAEGHFERGLGELERMQGLPYLARTRYERGRALQARGRPVDLARAYEQIARAGELADQVQLTGLLRLVERRLAELPPPSVRPSEATTIAATPASLPATTSLPFGFVCQGESWAVSYGGASFQLRDSLGLRYLARLFAEPGRELHVLELSGGAAEGAGNGEAAPAIDRGDAGELLDDEARRSYRVRAEELREALQEAETFGDHARAEAAREELDFLAAELSRAVGLGGRPRRAGAASERARSAVQRRIRSAIDRIRERSPELAALLERTVRTGTQCEFRPERAGTPGSQT